MFTSAHLHLCSSSHPHIISAHLHILTSTSHICTSRSSLLSLLRPGAVPPDRHETQPSAEIVRVECAKCRRVCDLSRSRATLCGDRACRGREMQARVRFVPVRSNPLRRSCVLRARNAGESAICPGPEQPSAEIVRVEAAKCRRECDLSRSCATLCGDRACRGCEVQARVRFGCVRRNPLRRSCVSRVRNAGESASWLCPAQPSAEIVRVECALVGNSPCWRSPGTNPCRCSFTALVASIGVQGFCALGSLSLPDWKPCSCCFREDQRCVLGAIDPICLGIVVAPGRFARGMAERLQRNTPRLIHVAGRPSRLFGTNLRHHRSNDGVRGCHKKGRDVNMCLLHLHDKRCAVGTHESLVMILVATSV